MYNVQRSHILYKLVVFDLDGTLAEAGQGITPENLSMLHELEERGLRIAICSGKPTYYLCGFMRQVGLKAPILVGENGAVIQFGVDLPPADYHVVPYSDEARRSIRLLRHAIDEALPDVWYQPNLTALTPFLKAEYEFDIIDQCISKLQPELKDITIYRHFDCFDFIPNGITKKSGLMRLGSLLQILPEETIAVGDGVNDYPMFEYAGLSLGIHLENPQYVNHNFPSIGSALRFLTDALR